MRTNIGQYDWVWKNAPKALHRFPHSNTCNGRIEASSFVCQRDRDETTAHCRRPAFQAGQIGQVSDDGWHRRWQRDLFVFATPACELPPVACISVAGPLGLRVPYGFFAHLEVEINRSRNRATRRKSLSVYIYL